MSSKRSQLIELLLLLNEAALDPTLWPEFLAAICAAAGAHGAAFFLHDLRTGKPLGVWSGFDDAQVALYTNYYASVNPWLPNSNFLLPQSNVIRGESFLSLERLRSTEFYNDWGKQND